MSNNIIQAWSQETVVYFCQVLILYRNGIMNWKIDSNKINMYAVNNK